MDPCLRSKKQIVNFYQKTDYENSPSQISYSNQPVVAQPMRNQMMSVNPPMSNMGHQIFQTPYGQTLMVPSNATISSPSQGQIYAQSTRSAQQTWANQVPSPDLVPNRGPDQVPSVLSGN